jgi:hypothetical protein
LSKQSKEKRYFYWYRNMFGRWSPCISDSLPGPRAQSRAPVTLSPVALEGVNEGLKLSECMLRWPVPAEASTEASAPDSAPVSEPETKEQSPDA